MFHLFYGADPYVRKTAAIAVAKMYTINRSKVEEGGFLDTRGQHTCWVDFQICFEPYGIGNGFWPRDRNGGSTAEARRPP